MHTLMRNVSVPLWFYAGQYAAQQHTIVATATATPKGNFSKRGLSSDIWGCFFNPNEKNPFSNVHVLRSVSITRPTRYI